MNIVELQTPLSQEERIKRFALDVQHGFQQTLKSIPSLYFYDNKGSELFTQITQLEEYYLTDCEREIFEASKAELTSFLPQGSFQVVELGAGDGQKTQVLMQEFLKQQKDFSYHPMDISHGALKQLTDFFGKRFPKLKQQALVSSYKEGLEWMQKEFHCPKLVLFIGSSIGNFNQKSCLSFLQELRKALNPGDLVLIGFDLRKDIQVMDRAYDDAKGVTSEFNYNLLERMNRELGANFKRENFKHHKLYNPRTSAMESYLISQKQQEVAIKYLNQVFELDIFEPVFLEFSTKYTEKTIQSLCEKSNFKLLKNFKDTRSYFVDSLWQVEPGA